MARKGKEKGDLGERQVIERITPWWRRVEPLADFARTPGSGGRVVARGFAEKGDIRPNPETCKLWPFSVESKWQRIVTPAAIEHFVAGEPSPIWGYWDQCCEAARKDSKRPLLWFRGNRLPNGRSMPWRVVFEDVDVLRLMLEDEFLALDPWRFLPRIES